MCISRRVIVKRIHTVISFVLLFVLCSTTWLGAGITGKIAGTIIDKESGETLPGSNVQIVGTTLGAAADLNGEYFIINIPPGEYTIRASMMGFITQEKTNVKVFVDKTTRINFDMEPKVLEGEEVTISAYRPDVVEKDLTATKRSYDVEQILSLPGVQDVDDIVDLQADVDGGHFRGGRSGEAIYLVGGAEINNPLTGSTTFNPIALALEQVEVYTSGFSAEYGNVQSGVINMVPKESGPTWETRVEVSSTNSRYKNWGGSVYSNELMEFYEMLYDPEEWLDGTDPTSGDPLYDFSAVGFANRYIPKQEFGFPLPPPPTRQDTLRAAMLTRNMFLQLARQTGLEYAQPDYRVEFTTGGPLAKNVRLFLAAQLNNNQPGLPLTERDRETQIMSNVVYRLNNNNRFQFIFNYNYQFDNDDPGFFNWYETSLGVSRVTETAQQYGVHWNHVLNQSTFFDVKINHLMTHEDEKIELAQPDELLDGYKNDTNWRFGKSPSGHQIGKPATSRGYNNTRTTNFKASITSQINNQNLIKSGLQFNYYDMNVDEESGITEIKNVRWDKYRVYPYEGAVYIQDKMEYEGLIANLGLRYDFYNFNTEFFTNKYAPYRNPDYSPTNPETGSYYDQQQAADKQSQFTAVFQPRLGFSFPVSDKTVLHLNYGVFTQRPAYEYIFISRLKLEGNPNFERLGNPQLEPEKTISYDMGIVRKFPFGLTLDLSAYYKNVSNLVQLAHYVDRDGFVYETFDNREYADIKGFHVSLDKNYGYIQGGIRYNWESATGQAGSALGAADQVVHYEGSPDKDELRNPKDIFLEFNRKHKLVFNLSAKTSPAAGFQIFRFRPLANLALTGVYRFLSGRPFTWDLTGKGLRMNQRTPDEHHLRLRVEKAFKLSTITKLTAYVEAFNVLNEKVWHYNRTFSEQPDNRYDSRYMNENQDVLTEIEFTPYVTRLEPYLFTNSPRYYRFGVYFNF
ncbi:TonB-dependent receptor [candidate division KSB1 bacterium]|nr:TonB-dependent receptor [candidate division KSB1 bacterium]